MAFALAAEQDLGDGLRVAASHELPDVVLRSGPMIPPGDLEQATSCLLGLLRPAA